MLPGALGQGPQAAVAIADGLQRVEWPARLQRLTRGPLVDLLPDRWEMWLDGGHNPAAGRALSLHIEERWGGRPVDLIVGMLNTKDVRGFLGPLVDRVRRLRAVTIPGEANSLLAEQVADAASALGIPAAPADDLASAVRDLAQDDGSARLLICGSLYLAGVVLRDNGS
jgi:dihydrofolate synthase/folylpolyglutamate synthase